jgi:hypothetical protein
MSCLQMLPFFVTFFLSPAIPPLPHPQPRGFPLVMCLRSKYTAQYVSILLTRHLAVFFFEKPDFYALFVSVIQFAHRGEKNSVIEYKNVI